MADSSRARRHAGLRLAPLVASPFLAAVLAFAYAGLFSRYVADDLCTASMLVERGFLGAQQTWYLTWTGRFAFTFVIDVLDWLGPWTVPLEPGVLLLAWLAAATAAVRPFVRGRLGSAVLLALLLVTASLGTAPQLWQSLYWQTGAVTYLLPIILATAYVALLWRLKAARASGRRLGTIGWTALGVVLMVVATACSETALAATVAGLGLATLATLVFYRASDRLMLVRTLGLSWLAALGAGVVVAVAPGNAVRGSLLQQSNLLAILAGPPVITLALLANVLTMAPAYLVLGYGLPFAVAASSPVAGRPAPDACLKVRRLLLPGGLIVAAASLFPSFYLQGQAPPQRAEIIPQAVLMATLLGCGFLDGLRRHIDRQVLRRHVWWWRLVITGAALALLFGPLLTTVRTILLADQLEGYAAALDAADQQVRQARAAGQRDVTVPRVHSPDVVRLDELGPNPDFVLNRCAATYYGVDSIRALD